MHVFSGTTLLADLRSSSLSAVNILLFQISVIVLISGKDFLARFSVIRHYRPSR